MGIVVCISSWPGFSEQDGTYLVGYQTTHARTQRNHTNAAIMSAPSSRSLNLIPSRAPSLVSTFVKPRLSLGIRLCLVIRVATGQ